MTYRTRRSRWFFVSGVLTVTLLVTAGCADGDNDPQRPDALPSAVSSVMQEERYASASWGLHVVDIETGEDVLALNPDALMISGSVTKLWSSAAAWLAFGPDHTFSTPLVHTGSVVDGVVEGDLVLVAQGDLFMGMRALPDGTVDYTDFDHNDANAIPGATLTDGDPLVGIDDLAAQISRAGITRIAGDVIVDDRLFETYVVGRDGPVSPIAVNDNLIDVVTTPSELGETATVEHRPAVSPFRVASEVETVDAGEPSSIQVEDRGDGELAVVGKIAADADPMLLVHHVEDPPSFARTALIEALGRAGVTVDATVTGPNAVDQLPSRAEVADLPVLAELGSMPFAEYQRFVLKISHNRGSETMICLLANRAGSTDCEDGLPEMASVLSEAGIDTDGFTLSDGAGLHKDDRMTGRAVTDLLVDMAGREDADRWLDTLPILGVDGSLSIVQPDSPAAGHVQAKTGSLAGGDIANLRLLVAAKGLAGYIDADSGRRLAFALYMNGATGDGVDALLQANDDLGHIAAAIQQEY